MERGSTLGAGHDTPGVGGDVDRGDGFVVTNKLVDRGESLSGALVKLDLVLAGDGELLAVGGEGVVGDGLVEEEVGFGSGHGGG